MRRRDDFKLAIQLPKAADGGRRVGCDAMTVKPFQLRTPEKP